LAATAAAAAKLILSPNFISKKSFFLKKLPKDVFFFAFFQLAQQFFSATA